MTSFDCKDVILVQNLWVRWFGVKTSSPEFSYADVNDRLFKGNSNSLIVVSISSNAIQT